MSAAKTGQAANDVAAKKLNPTHTARQVANELARKQAFKPVLDTPFDIKWPAVPPHARNQILEGLLELLTSVQPSTSAANPASTSTSIPIASSSRLVNTSASEASPKDEALSGPAANIADYRAAIWAKKRKRKPRTLEEKRDREEMLESRREDKREKKRKRKDGDDMEGVEETGSDGPSNAPPLASAVPATMRIPLLSGDLPDNGSHTLTLRSGREATIPNLVTPHEYNHLKPRPRGPPTFPTRPALLAHLVVGINSITKNLEDQIRQGRMKLGATPLSGDGTIANLAKKVVRDEKGNVVPSKQDKRMSRGTITSRTTKRAAKDAIAVQLASQNVTHVSPSATLSFIDRSQKATFIQAQHHKLTEIDRITLAGFSVQDDQQALADMQDPLRQFDSQPTASLYLNQPSIQGYPAFQATTLGTPDTILPDTINTCIDVTKTYTITDPAHLKGDVQLREVIPHVDSRLRGKWGDAFAAVLEGHGDGSGWRFLARKERAEQTKMKRLQQSLQNAAHPVTEIYTAPTPGTSGSGHAAAPGVSYIAQPMPGSPGTFIVGPLAGAPIFDPLSPSSARASTPFGCGTVADPSEANIAPEPIVSMEAQPEPEPQVERQTEPELDSTAEVDETLLAPLCPPQPLRLIFVCRADLNPQSLVAHLPGTVAAANEVEKAVHVKAVNVKGGEDRTEETDMEVDVEEEKVEAGEILLVQLPEGAERKVGDALGLRRVAAVGFDSTTPGLPPLVNLISHHLKPLAAPWLAPLPSTTISSQEPAHIPTHIKHYRTSMPVDPKAGRKEKVQLLKEGRDKRKRKKEKERKREKLGQERDMVKGKPKEKQSAGPVPKVGKGKGKAKASVKRKRSGNAE